MGVGGEVEGCGELEGCGEVEGCGFGVWGVIEVWGVDEITDAVSKKRSTCQLPSTRQLLTVGSGSRKFLLR